MWRMIRVVKLVARWFEHAPGPDSPAAVRWKTICKNICPECGATAGFVIGGRRRSFGSAENLYCAACEQGFRVNMHYYCAHRIGKLCMDPQGLETVRFDDV